MSNTNTEEWGNIELPGLSDEELFKKNWIKVEIGRETAEKNINNPSWIKKQREADEKRKAFGNSSEWIEYTRQLNQRESWKENNAKANKTRNEKIENRIAFEEGMKKRNDNEEWHQNVKTAAQNRDQSWYDSIKKAKEISGTPIITPEGIFLKFTDGVKHYMPIWNLKKGGADYRLRKLLDDENNKDFYRISLEEYIMLTGKDI